MKKIIIFMCLFWMGFIFYMSSNNGEISHKKSTAMVNLIENVQKDLETKSENKITDKKPEENKSTSKVQQIKENKLDYIVRKNAHGFMYMILAVLVSVLLFSFNKRGKYAINHILFICLFYAVTDEFHQSFVPGRTSLVSDVLVDFAGAIAGLMIFYLFYYLVYMKYKIKKS